MKCPKCGAAMEKVSFEEIEVDRCTGCHGIWFDVAEPERLAERKGSGSIDDGDRWTGSHLDGIEPIGCPRCETRMIRMVDARQPHIHYESCSVCYGVFFDAGEFRDFKHHTLADFFRDLLARERE